LLGRGFLGGALRLVDLAHRPIDVGQQAERESLKLLELPVQLGLVEGDAEDLGAGPFELGGSVTEPLALGRSTRAGGQWVPPHHHPSPAQVREGHRVPVLVRKGEPRRGRSFAKHQSSKPWRPVRARANRSNLQTRRCQCSSLP
jgi:hypothetical protein